MLAMWLTLIHSNQLLGIQDLPYCSYIYIYYINMHVYMYRLYATHNVLYIVSNGRSCVGTLELDMLCN